MTSYALITPDGKLSFSDGDWRAEIGPEGHNRVTLDPYYGAAAWVNDVSLLFPDRFPRSVVGSIALLSMGAAPQPYAGPIVITGWHPVAEVVELPGVASMYLPSLVKDIALALDGDVEATRHIDGAWCAAVADTAALIREEATS